jgi:hypothetical protein
VLGFCAQRSDIRRHAAHLRRHRSDFAAPPHRANQTLSRRPHRTIRVRSGSVATKRGLCWRDGFASAAARLTHDRTLEGAAPTLLEGVRLETVARLSEQNTLHRVSQGLHEELQNLEALMPLSIVAPHGLRCSG